MSTSITQMQEYVQFASGSAGRTSGQVSPGGKEEFWKFLPSEDSVPTDVPTDPTRSVESGSSQTGGVMTSGGGAGSQEVAPSDVRIVSDQSGSGRQGSTPTDVATTDYSVGSERQGVSPSDAWTVSKGVDDEKQELMPVDVWTSSAGEVSDPAPTEVKWVAATPASIPGPMMDLSAASAGSSAAASQAGDPASDQPLQLSSVSDRLQFLNVVERYSNNALLGMLNSATLAKLT
jgi:hypothetical protein